MTMQKPTDIERVAERACQLEGTAEFSAHVAAEAAAAQAYARIGTTYDDVLAAARAAARRTTDRL